LQIKEQPSSSRHITWKKPSSFPRAATLAARVACANASERWIGDFVTAALDGVDRPGESVIAEATAPERKALFRANTGQAIRLRLCVAPNCVVGGEIFWGEETLDDAIAWSRR